MLPEGFTIGALIFAAAAECAYAAETTCYSCEDCTSKLNGSYDVVLLNTSIYNHNGTCISFPTNNKIFDCQGNTIDGVWGGHGIDSSTFSNHF